MSIESYGGRPAGVARQNMRFEVVEGPRVGEVLQVPLPEPGEPAVLIGRSRECAIWIDAQNISRRNTEIFVGPDRRPLVRDMGSVNGTQLNGQSLSQTTPLPLTDGDLLRLGLSELRFVGLVAMQPSNPVPTLPSTPLPPVPMPLPPQTGNFATPRLGISSPLPTVPPNLTMSGVGITAPSPLRPATLPGEYSIYLAIRGGQRYLFEGEEASVGRGQANDIVIDSNSISRQHARLQKTVAGVFVHDLGSTNKTFVNGVQADGPVLLRDTDVVRFGDIETDFKLEPPRLAATTKLTDPDDFDSTETTTFQNRLTAADPTQTVSDQTYVGPVRGDATFVGNRPIGGGAGPVYASLRQNLDQFETALDLDVREVRIVGRNLRQASDVVPEVAENAKSVARTVPLIEVAHLEGVYLTEGSGRALDLILSNVRLGLKPGELVALVGPSGSGKTELLELMAGLRAADRGQVTVLGRPLPTLESNGGQRPNLLDDKEWSRWRLRSVGYLPGEPVFTPKQSALEHVMWQLEQGGFGRDPRERMEKALERLRWVGMNDAEVVRLRPPDLNRTERKQLALARALALEPSLVLADEPTGRVHSAAADSIFRLLKSLAAKGNTVFMVTSDPLWARNADRQIEILDGAIVGGLS